MMVKVELVGIDIDGTFWIKAVIKYNTRNVIGTNESTVQGERL